MRVSYFIQEMIEMINEVQMKVSASSTDLDNKRI
jgi:hypothetical protein